MLIQRMEGGKLQLLLPPHNTAAVLLADAAAALDMCDYHATVLAMCDRLDGQPSPAMAAKAMASTSRNHTDD